MLKMMSTGLRNHAANNRERFNHAGSIIDLLQYSPLINFPLKRLWLVFTIGPVGHRIRGFRLSGFPVAIKTRSLLNEAKMYFLLHIR